MVIWLLCDDQTNTEIILRLPALCARPQSLFQWSNLARNSKRAKKPSSATESASLLGLMIIGLRYLIRQIEFVSLSRFISTCPVAALECVARALVCSSIGWHRHDDIRCCLDSTSKTTTIVCMCLVRFRRASRASHWQFVWWRRQNIDASHL